MNPELRRNLWLELTLHRVLAMPIVLGLVFVLVWTMNASAPLDALASAASMIFLVLCMGWGTYLAGESVVAELRGRTWDGQRMSAIEPWTMTVGKLAGATAFAWYGGLLCVAVYLVASPAHAAWMQAGLMVCGAVMLHALALVASLATAHRGLGRASMGGWVIALLFLVGGPWTAFIGEEGKAIRWWGLEWERAGFLLCMTGAFAAWAVFGAHRLMCQALQVRTRPWAWIAFLLFVGGLFAGFAIHDTDSWTQVRNVHFVAMLLVALLAVYVLLLAEAATPMVLRRVFLLLRAGDRRRALEESPLWPLTLALAALFALLLVFVSGSRTSGDELFRVVQLAPLALLLLVVRDAAIFMVFAFAARPRRVEAAAMLYLVLLYGLVPAIFRGVEFNLAANLVLPPFWDHPVMATLVAAMHAALAVGLAVWRWKRNILSTHPTRTERTWA